MARRLLFIVMLTLNREDVPGGGLRGTPPRKWGTVKNHFPEGYCPRREKVLRCFADDMPTVSETLGPYEWMGRADDLAQLIRWWDEVSKDMDSREALDTLRRRFLSTPFGNSLKTRHAYDHLVEGVRWDYGLEWKER